MLDRLVGAAEGPFFASLGTFIFFKRKVLSVKDLKAYGGMDVHLRSLLTSELDSLCVQLHSQRRFNPRDSPIVAH